MEEHGQQDIQRRLDAITEQQVHQGYVDLDLPAHLVAQLEEAHELDAKVPVVRRVRFLRLTPRRRQQVSQAVMRRYHADLQDDGILSTEQLLKINIKRGEWSNENEARLTSLQEETNRLMQDLHFDDFDPEASWLEEIAEQKAMIVSDAESTAQLAEEQGESYDLAKFIQVLTRWIGHTAEAQDEYDALFAKDQNKDIYVAEADEAWLLANTPSDRAADAISYIDDLKWKLQRYLELVRLRSELYELQIKRTRIIADSVEQRRDTAEEMARMYYCSEVVDEDGKGVGRITKTYDDLWDLPEEVTQWLMVESFMFMSGIAPEAREYLEKWSFIPRQSGSPEPLDESPDLPTSSSDLSEPQPASPSSSD